MVTPNPRHLSDGVVLRMGIMLLLLFVWASLTAIEAAQNLDTSLVVASDERLFHRQAYVMGTRVTLAVRGSDPQESMRGLEEMLRVLETADQELSTWRTGSVLSRLNRHPVGEAFAAPSEFCGLVDELDRWRTATAGAFDPAIGALVRAWGLRERGRVPSASERRVAQSSSGLSWLRVRSVPSCVLTRMADVTLDAGGFGKGLALDRLVRHRLGSRSGAPSLQWMVDFGGQVAVGPIGMDRSAAPMSSASADPQTGWRVAVAHPVYRDQAVLELRLPFGSLAVSGGSERDRFVEGVRVGHILDPRQGVPANQSFAVAVWHRSAFVADVLSTALYVMGVDDGIRWAEANDIAVCYVSPVTDESRPGPFRATLRASLAFRTRFQGSF